MLDIAPETNEVIDEIRRSVAALCEKFPGEYWREQDRERAYPTEFVKALTDAGFLAVLVPEEYGGSGLSISAAAAVLEDCLLYTSPSPRDHRPSSMTSSA